LLADAESDGRDAVPVADGQKDTVALCVSVSVCVCVQTLDGAVVAVEKREVDTVNVGQPLSDVVALMETVRERDCDGLDDALVVRDWKGVVVPKMTVGDMAADALVDGESVLLPHCVTETEFESESVAQLDEEAVVL